MIKKSVFFVVVLFFVACGNKTRVNLEQADLLLSSLSDKMIDMEYADISLQQIDSLIDIYASVRDNRRESVVRLIKGAKLYSINDYSGAIDELKIAEQYIDEEDAMQGRLYYYLSRVLEVENPFQSTYYAKCLVDWADENSDLLLSALGYKLLMNLEDDIDSATIYRNKAIEAFDFLSDTLRKEKTNARFAMKFLNQLTADSAINMILPFYNHIGYVRDADALATIYLVNNQADLTYDYIERLQGVAGFEFQYYNNMAVYYSLKGEFEKSLIVYDSAFHIYQQQAEQILDAQIARVNGEYDKKLYDQQIELQHYRTILLSLVFILLAIAAIVLIMWLIRIVRYHRLKNKELKQAKEILEEKNEELVDTTKKQTQKLYAVSDICKNTYASIVTANPDMVKVISRSLYENLKETYPQLSNMDFTYMFLDFIGLNAKDICRILSVQEGTYYCRRSAIKKKLGTELDQDIDEIFNQFFLGQTIPNEN
ncbi:MAG: hypothetical protein J6A44_03985 [Paludibacteraceae bacterium]|nr:hypothetical protein [Paludibacteraceae bacterium]